MHFRIARRAGKVLLRHTEGEYDWTPADEIHKRAAAAIPAEGDALQRGTDQELQGELPAALRTYREGLQHLSGDFALSVAAGRLCAGLQRYAEAIAYLEPAAARATWNPEIAYYLGLAYDGAAEAAKARLAYETAARMPSWRAAASLKLGELLSREGDREAGLQFLDAAQGDLRAREEMSALMHSLGRTPGRLAAAQELTPSPFLQWDSGAHNDAALLRFLAADPPRVLEIAAEYMRLGLYRQAVDLLARDFPPVPPDETEPGAVLPQKHPLIAYYRGYCRAKLGESAAADYAAAQKLSTLYVFPSRAEDLEVLRAAAKTNPEDMTARYLLGTQLFARGLTDDALTEWNAARHADARIPVLHADIGRALLREKHDSIGALQVFREGLAVDPLNRQLYEGVDEALSLMSRPARELAVSLEHYPDPAHMPAELVYALALDRAEALDFENARALFPNRFFPREEGGTNVRQVWVEVNILAALSQAAAKQCDSALQTVDGLGGAVAGLPFTKDGLEPFVNAPAHSIPDWTGGSPLRPRIASGGALAPRSCRERHRGPDLGVGRGPQAGRLRQRAMGQAFRSGSGAIRIRCAVHHRRAGSGTREAARRLGAFPAGAAAAGPHDVASPGQDGDGRQRSSGLMR